MPSKMLIPPPLDACCYYCYIISIIGLATLISFIQQYSCNFLDSSKNKIKLHKNAIKKIKSIPIKITNINQYLNQQKIKYIFFLHSI